MIVDAVYQVYEWLVDGTTGINAVRSSIPRDALVTAPSAVTVAHGYSAAWIARGTLEREKITSAPIVHVLAPQDEVQTPALAERGNAGSLVSVLVRYAVRGASTHDLQRDCTQVLRAAARACSAPFNDSTFADITRNGVSFGPPEFRYMPLSQEDGDDLVIGVLVVTMHALDRWAHGASS